MTTRDESSNTPWLSRVKLTPEIRISEIVAVVMMLAALIGFARKIELALTETRFQVSVNTKAIAQQAENRDKLIDIVNQMRVEQAEFRSWMMAESRLREQVR